MRQKCRTFYLRGSLTEELVPQLHPMLRSQGTGIAPNGGSSLKKPRILLVGNMDRYFLSHRLPIAQAAQSAGAEVVVATADTGRAEVIRRKGLTFVSLPMSRSSTSIIRELRTFWSLVLLFRQVRPDLIHNVTIKPVLYGSFVARMLGSPAVVNAITGLGYVFTQSRRAKFMRALIKMFYKFALHHPRSRTIFQNPDDFKEFVSQGLVRREQAVLIRGSGVDCSLFEPAPEPVGEPVVMLPSRMLWDKGVREFVDMACVLKGEGIPARFVLVGDSDSGNPTAVPVSQLETWAREGVVEWWGHREDMPAVLKAASVVVLPSYREGLPKVLLEAAASGRPIVATDVPGCREIVRPHVNGLLVPCRDVPALAQAVKLLLESPELRARFGEAGRRIALAEFAQEIVVQQTLDVYRHLLLDKWPEVLQ